MEWGEAVRLVTILGGDPSSHVAAAMLKLDYPLERVGWMLADLIDVQGTKWQGKKWKSYPRPSDAKRDNKRWGDTGGRTRAEVVAILNARGHTLSA